MIIIHWTQVARTGPELFHTLSRRLNSAGKDASDSFASKEKYTTAAAAAATRKATTRGRIDHFVAVVTYLQFPTAAETNSDESEKGGIDTHATCGIAWPLQLFSDGCIYAGHVSRADAS